MLAWSEGASWIWLCVAIAALAALSIGGVLVAWIERGWQSFNMWLGLAMIFAGFVLYCWMAAQIT